MIVDKKTYHKLRKWLLIGILFSVMTVIGGEMPLGWTVTPSNDDPVKAMLMGYANISLQQMAAGVLIDGIGISMQYYGYKAIAEIVRLENNQKSAALIDLGAKAIAGLGGIVHILCVALMFILKSEASQGNDLMSENVMNFTLWLVLPITVVFMLAYLPMTIAMMISIGRGKTLFPKAALFLNPMFAKILFNVIAGIAPNTELINGIRMINMGLGSLLTFVGLLLLLISHHKKNPQPDL